MSIQVRVASLIRTIPEGEPVKIFEGDVEGVLNQVRNECNKKGNSLVEWALMIREHGPVPVNHPFAILCERLGIPLDHPLRTLGSWAFGFQNTWITIEWIKTESGKMITRQSFDPFCPR